MPEIISIRLNEKSVQKAIDKIDAYADNLEKKVETYLEKLAEAGIAEANISLMDVDSDNRGGANVHVGDKTSNSITVNMGGSKALFIEFGAGITYSNPQHPKAGEMGYGVGTYPYQKHALDPRGWWYSTGGQKHIHSYGNRAYMPLYNASQSIKEQAAEIAKEVFWS